ncbi:nephrin-like [Eriocheir sinensis]|uniref:nephrin-like n=1 Tax=Eriocheir sinensis TaxID=95602 RepID=UPI0021C89BD5|nr:nephrin-like [Eriocheir sinensis]
MTDMMVVLVLGPVTPAVAVAGGQAVLPCNISSLRGDSFQLVLWYRDHVPTPVFSYDARSGAYSRPKEWSDPKILGERAHFTVTTAPAALVLNFTRRTDQAVYRCRVDYKHLTTTHARVNLTVIEPVSGVRIVDELGTELVGAAGPYTLEQRPSLTCRAGGGDPSPTVTWWKDGRLIDSTYHYDPASSTPAVPWGSSGRRDGGQVTTGVPEMVNTIHLRALKKENLHDVYTCKAANHDLAPVREATIQLDMNFGPDEVEMSGLEEPVSAGWPHKVMCLARGSRPPPILTWWLEGHMQKSVSYTTSIDGLVSTSTLELKIEPEDEGKTLTCRAENPEIPAASIEESQQLQVLYPPEVKVAAGPSLDLDHIKEGDDVYFDCHVNARPDPHKITWMFNGEELQQNTSARVMVVGRSLVMQKVSRRQAGSYTCGATNTQGSNTSAPIHLSVKYSPVCRVEQTDVYGVGRHEKTTVTCRVEADPPVTSYRWAFNNTGEFVDIPSSHYNIKNEDIKSQRSDLRYSPVSDLDYGTLLCWATNAVGTQRTPCTFTVFPAGKPDVPSSCLAFNETENSVSVSCEPGYSGGVDQSFLLEAWDDGVVRATDTSDSPLLQVSGLRPGTRYTLKIFAVNAMGRSQPYIFTAFTLTDVAERRTALGAGQEGEPLSPVVGAVLGGVAAVVVLAVVALVVARCRRAGAPEEAGARKGGEEGVAGEGSYSKAGGKSGTQQDSAHDAAGPDLVSTSKESAMMSHSHDSTTPLIGNGRLLQGQKQELMYQTQQQQQAKQQQQQYTPQQHHLHDPHKAKHVVIVDASPGETSPFYQEEALADVSGGGGGGGGGTLPYQQRSKVAYVPVYQHQHQHQGDWAGMGEGAWSSGTPAGSSGVGMGVGVGLGAEQQQQQQQQQPSTNSPLDPYGIVDPRRHSAYLRPLDTLPPQVTHLPTHLSDHQLSRQTQPQPPFTTPTHPHHLSSTPHSPASSSSAASTLFKASSEHESSV